MPAAAAMFTEEIGYPPYWGSRQVYRQGIESLIRQGHTFVRVDDGEVVFKADVGSVALGVAQIQGSGSRRNGGQGLAGPAMATVVERVQAEIAEWSRSTSTTSTCRPGRRMRGWGSPR